MTEPTQDQLREQFAVYGRDTRHLTEPETATPTITHISYGIPFDVYAPTTEDGSEYVTDAFPGIAEDLFAALGTAYPGAAITVFCDHSEYMSQDFRVTFADEDTDPDHERWREIREQIEQELLPPIIARHIV